MKLQYHINESIRKYPLLFKAENMDKSSILVLKYLFLVNGNGYEWFDGYLVKYTQETPEPYGKIKSKPLPDKFFDLCEVIICDFKPYPLSKYSKLNNIPSNIRQDWLEGAIKIAMITLAFFTNRKAVKSYCYYPSPKEIRSVTRRFEKLTKEGRFIDVAVNLWGAKANEEFKPELYVRRLWKNHRREQIRSLLRFLAKHKLNEAGEGEVLF